MLRLIIIFIFALFQFSSYSQWINEIHYDNSGGDLNEGFEITGLAGTDLSCYDVVLYNGSNQNTYSTLNLSGTIPDEGCGYGAIWFNLAGIQNGGPDGIALYNTCTTTLIQFLSYEGAFTAGNGVAVGVMSTDIGVSETGSTLTTESLQLTGAGSNYTDYSWNAATASSHSALNPGQSIIPCGSNSITTGTLTGNPFTVDCAGTTDAGTIDFTSTGTFIGGNIYTAQLSDAAGSFASPTSIGTLASTANLGTINITIPAVTASGSGYLIRVISDNPVTTGSSGAVFTITQTGTCGPTLPAGLIINEWSNGPAGSQEYYEFVVAGQCGELVDIRGYILDDNNGTFTTPASYSGTASGIAPGHFRFAFVAQWASIPVGSLILIYNANDPNTVLPADDPTDANNDSLYVVPHNNALFERCLSMPMATTPDSLYTPCTYTVSPLSGWGALSLRNSGDAIQVRQPDGTYYQGVSYGGSEISGGPNNLKLFTGSGSAMAGWFSNGDFFDISNWTSGAANVTNQTPGLTNNALNQAWLLEMRDSQTENCPFTILPVEITLFEGWNEPYGNKIIWETATEKNSDYFVIDRSIDGKSWIEVQTIKSVGNSETTSKYSTVDIGFEEVMNYYRLSQYDLDGTEKRHYKSVTIDNSIVSDIELIGIYNILGQPVTYEYKGLQIHVFSNGTSKKVLH